MSFTHQTANEIITTRHVRAPDDLEEVQSSRECYLQILSMTIVAEREKKENNGEDNESIIHLKNTVPAHRSNLSPHNKYIVLRAGLIDKKGN